MFTYTALGKTGRFGNHLFHIAATLGMAAKHGVGCIFPRWEHAVYFKRPIPQTAEPLIPRFALAQRAFDFTDISVSVEWPCLIDLFGGFQSEKFFAHCAKTVREYFEPSPLIADALKEKHPDGPSPHPSCIVVVRRGDYALYPEHHPMQPRSFYCDAMGMFDRDTTFFVTSDDIEWCRENLIGRRVVFLPQHEWVLNFFLGTLCDDAIISNTSFGWWLAWLNTHAGAKVVAPKLWFGPGYARYDTQDLLPEKWIRV